MKKKLVTAISVVGYILLFAGLALIIISDIYILIIQGFGAFLAILSPFNWVNWIFSLIVVAPGVGLLVLADKLKGDYE